MKSYIVYNIDGKILRTGTTPDTDFNNQNQTGQFIIEGVANDVTQYVATPTAFVEDKPAMVASIDKVNIIPNGIDTITIASLPIPTEIIVKEVLETNTSDGEFKFTINAPGSYKIICKSFPYLDKEYNINAS